MAQHNDWNGGNTAVEERAPARRGFEIESAVEHDAGGGVDEERRGQGFKDLIGGAVLIGIGLVMGGSVFTGDPSAIDWVFDGLGTFWVAKGVYLIATS